MSLSRSFVSRERRRSFCSTVAAAISIENSPLPCCPSIEAGMIGDHMWQNRDARGGAKKGWGYMSSAVECSHSAVVRRSPPSRLGKKMRGGPRKSRTRRCIWGVTKSVAVGSDLSWGRAPQVTGHTTGRGRRPHGRFGRRITASPQTATCSHLRSFRNFTARTRRSPPPTPPPPPTTPHPPPPHGGCDVGGGGGALEIEEHKKRSGIHDHRQPRRACGLTAGGR